MSDQHITVQVTDIEYRIFGGPKTIPDMIEFELSRTELEQASRVSEILIESNLTQADAWGVLNWKFFSDVKSENPGDKKRYNEMAGTSSYSQKVIVTDSGELHAIFFLEGREGRQVGCVIGNITELLSRFPSIERQLH